MKHRKFISLAIASLFPCSVLSSPAAYNLSPKQIANFQQDGVIIVRGLLQGKELKDAIKSANRLQQFKSMGKRLMYKMNPTYRNLEFQTWRKSSALEKVAFDSAAPTICAKLMGLDADSDVDGGKGNFRPLRLLKDAVLGYSAGDVGCGWHVDDRFFWPCEDRNIGQRDAGVNVWITLSPISAAAGGGLAVAPGSHRVKFANKAREAIAPSHMTTCALQKLAPDCHEKMEKLKKVYDLAPGDAIIHDRYVFHRPDHFTDLVKGKKERTKQRISLRYVPADATYFNNNMDLDPGTALKSLKTGDAVSKAGEYFPQAWPDRLPEEKKSKVRNEVNLFTLENIFRMVLKKK